MKRTFLPIIIFCVSAFIVSVLFAPVASCADGKELTCQCWKCGKTFTAPLGTTSGKCPHCAAKFAMKAPSPSPGAEPAMIPWQAAGDYVNQTKTVEGVIVGTHFSERSKSLYLNFSQEFWKYLSVKIPAAQRGGFRGDAESFYKGKKIRATGQICREGQYLRLVVLDPNDLKVIQ